MSQCVHTHRSLLLLAFSVLIYHIKRTPFSLVRRPRLPQLPQGPDTFDPQVGKPSLSVHCRLWSRHVDAALQIGSRRWVVLMVCACSKTNCPCWWQAPDEWVPHRHMAIYFTAIMSQRTQSFLLLYTRPMYAHKQQCSLPHWRITPLLWQIKQVEAETTVYTNTAGHTYSTRQLAPHRVSVNKAGGCWLLQKLFFIQDGNFD